MANRYLPHVLYATLLTSVSIHVLAQRSTQAEERARCAAQISLLEDLVARLHIGNSGSDSNVDEAEVERVRRLVRAHDFGRGVRNGVWSEGDAQGGETTRAADARRTSVRWADVLWGRKHPTPGVSSDESDKWEHRELEQLRRELSEDT